jgi:hypothetical protein
LEYVGNVVARGVGKAAAGGGAHPPIDKPVAKVALRRSVGGAVRLLSTNTLLCVTRIRPNPRDFMHCHRNFGHFERYQKLRDSKLTQEQILFSASCNRRSLQRAQRRPG